MYGRNRRSPSAPRGGRGGHGGGGRYHIMIKNIAFEVDWKQLKDIIKEAGVEPKFAQIVENRGRSAGFGFAAFHTESEMRQACQRLARKNVMGRDLFVIEDNDLSKLEELKQSKGISGGGGGDRGRGGDRGHGGDRGVDRGYGGENVRSGGGDFRSGGDRKRQINTGDVTLNGIPVTNIPGLDTLDTETIESLGSGELGPKIFAYNLIFELSERKLREVFDMAGEVRDLRIPKKGHAIIEYNRTIDALRAIIMLRNQNLNGRKMMIKMDGAPFAKHSESKPNFDDRKRMRYNDDPPPRNEPPPQRNFKSYDQAPPRPHHSAPPTRLTPPAMHIPPPTHNPPPDHYAQESRYSQPPPPIGGPPPVTHYGYQEKSSSESYSKKVRLENLPLSVTTATIRQMFEEVGGVDYVQLSDGGRCEVEFFNDHHPQQAVRKFDGYNLEGRSIKVYIDAGRS